MVLDANLNSCVGLRRRGGRELRPLRVLARRAGRRRVGRCAVDGRRVAGRRGQDLHRLGGDRGLGVDVDPDARLLRVARGSLGRPRRALVSVDRQLDGLGVLDGCRRADRSRGPRRTRGRTAAARRVLLGWSTSLAAPAAAACRRAALGIVVEEDPGDGATPRSARARRRSGVGWRMRSGSRRRCSSGSVRRTTGRLAPACPVRAVSIASASSRSRIISSASLVALAPGPWRSPGRRPRPGHWRPRGGGSARRAAGSRTCFMATATWFSPWNGMSPVSISNSTMPSE